jgi:hypothetical protein
MDTSDVILEADYCGIRAAQYPGNSGSLCGDSANVSRKLVCNANLGSLPALLHSSECFAEENMVTTPNQSWCSSNTIGGQGVASSSYSR